MPAITSKQQADILWTNHKYYWNDSDLIAKQRIVIYIGSLSKSLLDRGIDEMDYWNEVKKYIYEK